MNSDSNEFIYKFSFKNDDPLSNYIPFLYILSTIEKKNGLDIFKNLNFLDILLNDKNEWIKKFKIEDVDIDKMERDLIDLLNSKFIIINIDIINPVNQFPIYPNHSRYRFNKKNFKLEPLFELHIWNKICLHHHECIKHPLYRLEKLRILKNKK